MATRMQQRRGTAAQWSSSNPTLGAGEIGWESDTNKFKIGDGTNQWNDLDYFVDQASLNTSLGDYVETSVLDQPNGVATLDSNSKLKTSQLPDVALVTVHAVADQAARLALSVEPGDIAIQIDSGQTYVLSASPASTNANWTAITVADPFPTKDTDDLAEGTINKYFTNQRALDATSAAYELAGSVSTHNSDTTNVHGIADTSKLVKTDSLSTTLDGDLVVDGDFTVNGTNFAASATSIVIEDNLVQLAHQNSGNIVDLGIVVGYNDGTAKHAGIVRDVSSDKWKLFKGVTTEPSTTVDFTQGTLDDLEVAGLVASSATIGDVSNTELQYLNGVTSSIQTQIDSKLSSSTAASTYATIASPTFTGTVSGVTKSMVGLGNVDNTSDADKPVSTATQTALNLKANLASPTFTGTVVLPNNTVTNDMLAGSIANNKLTNSSITINGSVVALGSSTTIDSLPSQTGNAGDFLVTNGTSASWVQGPVISTTNKDITSDFSIESGRNGFSVGTITINEGVYVTVPDGSTWEVL